MKDRSRLLGAVIRDGSVLRVHANHDRTMKPRFLGRHIRESSQNNEISWRIMMSSGSVDAHRATAPRSLECVSHQAGPPRHVPNMNGLVGKNLSGIEQIRVDGNATLVVQVRERHLRAMDLRFEYV